MAVKKVFIIVLFLLGHYYLLVAQECSCKQSLEKLNEFVKQNYVGYSTKFATIKAQKKLTSFVETLKIEVQSYNTIDCIKILRRYIQAFDDRHLSVEFSEKFKDYDGLIKNFQKAKKTNLSEKEIINYLEKKEKDEIEGFWEDEPRQRIISIFKQDSYFTGVYIKADNILSFPLQIKMKIRKDGANNYRVSEFYDTYQVKAQPYLQLEGDVLKLRGHGYWYRISSPAASVNQEEPNLDPSLKKAYSNTIVLKLPSFSLTYKKKIDSLIDENDSLIQNTKYLIVDLRGNSGGSIYSFEKLLKYAYTEPMIIRGAYALSSKPNIEYFQKRANNAMNDEKTKAVLQNQVSLLLKNEGKLVELWKNDTLIIEKKYEFPQKIAVLIDQNTGSAAELLLLRLKYSKKAIICGDNSSGIVDFGDATTIELPCSNFSLSYPISMRNNFQHVSYDKNGIAPDFRISFKIKDWLEYSHRILESKNQ